MQLPKLLKTRFGFDHFLPMQEDIVRHILAGQDALILMPTGGGKSLCYQLPALVFDGLTLVVSPLIALMKDQVDRLKANGIAAELLNSSLTAEEISYIKIRLRNRQIKILYIAPERLAIEGFREFLRGLAVSCIAIDEAHCVSQWGHNFRPEYLNLKNLRNDFPKAGMMALTATATPRVRKDIIEHLHLNKPRTFLSSFNRPNLHYYIISKDNAFQKLLGFLQAPHRKGQSSIIYCFSRRETEDLAANLCANKLTAEAYHAGLKAWERHAIQDRFIKDETPIIVATIAFGMGIDKPNIRSVIHYTLPASIEGYYQETGRAGRDGLEAKCILFYARRDRSKHEYFIDRIENKPERARAMDKLNKVMDFCEGTGCRREHLLRYFGESCKEKNCGHCDNCTHSKDSSDIDKLGRMILKYMRIITKQPGGEQ